MSDIKPEFRSDTAYCSEKCPSCVLQIAAIQSFQCIAGRLRCQISLQTSMCAPWYKAKLAAVREWTLQCTDKWGAVKPGYWDRLVAILDAGKETAK